MSVFDVAAELYDRARPEYPGELFDDLVALAQLEAGDRLLEVGCATGKATRQLLARGFRVTCVELGPQLAAVARRNVDADIHVGRFEEWEGGGGFDLVVAATAWHWLDPDVRYRKAHEVLRPGGHLAFWGATHVFPPGFDPFFTDIQDVYDAIGESHSGEWPAEPDDESDDILRSGLFGDVHVRRYVWELQYTAEEYIALLDTFSGHIEMTDAQRATLYAAVRDRLGSRRVRRHWGAALHVATRLDM